VKRVLESETRTLLAQDRGGIVLAICGLCFNIVGGGRVCALGCVVVVEVVGGCVVVVVGADMVVVQKGKKAENWRSEKG